MLFGDRAKNFFGKRLVHELLVGLADVKLLTMVVGPNLVIECKLGKGGDILWVL